MAPNDHLLQQLCRKPETLNHAQSLLRHAQMKTGPGSGHELGPHTTGLAAICAHIASQRLNNADVSRKQAQIASCLKASDFEKAFHIVEAAIGGARRQSNVNGVYESLIQKYRVPIDNERAITWLRAAERALLQSDNRISHDDPDTKRVMFFWMCDITLGKTIATPRAFSEDNNMSLKTFNKLLDKITSTCSSLKSRIQRETNAKRSSRIASSPATPHRPPTKAALRALPSKDSPRKPAAVAPPQSEPDHADHSSEEERGDIAAAGATPGPSASHQTRRTSQRAAADSMDVDEDIAPPSSSDESEDTETPVPRRFRPVYLDHQQWYGLDTRLDRIWKQRDTGRQH